MLDEIIPFELVQDYLRKEAYFLQVPRLNLGAFFMFNFNEGGQNALYLTLQETAIFMTALLFFVGYLIASIIFGVKKRRKATAITAIVTIFAFTLAVIELSLSYGLESGKNILNLKPAQAEEFVVALTYIACLFMVGIAIFNAKKPIFKQYVKFASVLTINYAIGSMIYHFIADFESSDETILAQIILAVVLVVCAVATVVLSRVEKTSKMFDTKAIAYAGICLSICFALSYIRLFRMPNAGSITLASLTLLGIYAYMFGVGRGLIVALIYGVLQFIQGPFVINIWSALLDYPLAFLGFGLVGAFRGRFKNIYAELSLGFLIAIVWRYAMHTISGALFIAGENIGVDAWTYSLVYNLTVLIDGAIALGVALGACTSKQVRRLIYENGNKRDIETVTEITA